MKISVIIPTCNEAENIGDLVESLKINGRGLLEEVIVVDGKSTDNTLAIAARAGAEVVKSAEKGRAVQMNLGASLAKGDILYFVHADIKIHADYAADIAQAVNSNYDLGCYRFRFDSNSLLLRLNAWFTRLPFIWCRGGDQTLFISKEKFNQLGRYKAHCLLMEDYDFIIRAKEAGCRFRIIPKCVKVSARKYETNSYFKVQRANYTVMKMWKQGASQKELVATYKRMLDYR